MSWDIDECLLWLGEKKAKLPLVENHWFMYYGYSYYKGGIETIWPQSLKCLPSGPSQKKFVDPFCHKKGTRYIPRPENKLQSIWQNNLYKVSTDCLKTTPGFKKEIGKNKQFTETKSKWHWQLKNANQRHTFFLHPFKKKVHPS